MMNGGGNVNSSDGDLPWMWLHGEDIKDRCTRPVWMGRNSSPYVWVVGTGLKCMLLNYVEHSI